MKSSVLWRRRQVELSRLSRSFHFCRQSHYYFLQSLVAPSQPPDSASRIVPLASFQQQNSFRGFAHNLDTACSRARRNVRQRRQLPTSRHLLALQQKAASFLPALKLPSRQSSLLLPPPVKPHQAPAFPTTRHGSPPIASSLLLLLPLLRNPFVLPPMVP